VGEAAPAVDCSPRKARIPLTDGPARPK
jgi:hypothetical protein